MISDDHIAQISDFRVACILDVEGFTALTKTDVRYTAPELMPISELVQDVRPTLQSDIYSLGILFLQVRIRLLCGQTYNDLFNITAVPCGFRFEGVETWRKTIQSHSRGCSGANERPQRI